MKLDDIVHNHVDVIGDKQESLNTFYDLSHTVMYLQGGGVIAYSHHLDYYFIHFVYTAGLLSNARIVYNTAKQLSKFKSVLYSGTRDYYRNNSEKIGEDLYKIKFKE